jgi:eukaryotic-like serine/threonine-protein kinase
VNSDLFKRAEEVFFKVRGLPPSQRDAILDRECNGDEALRAEVLSLLHASIDATRFLDTPALGSSIAGSIQASGLEEEDLSGQVIGVWLLTSKIAAGGMGAVYAAQRADGQFQQRVAVKVVKRGLDTDEILRRFKAERQTLAALNHPNIARILDGGVSDTGRPYLVMELVEGQPIDLYTDAHQLDVRPRLKLMRTVCEAVRAAHQALVVHRDLKPSNILVDDSGFPKLLDFGIAKVLASRDGTAAVTMTSAQEQRLTPEYASPEQVRGEPIGTATDVYSLGVILYELLAGQRPYGFQTCSRAEVERIVCNVNPPPPSAVAGRRGGPAAARRAKALRGDLDTIILMAMRKEQERRYPSIDALMADIDRYLEGHTVQARPDTLGYRVSKFVRRNPLPVGLATLAVLSLVGGVIGTTWQRRVALQERDEAFIARDQAEAAVDFLRESLSAADINNEGPEAKVRSFVDAAALSAPATFKDRPLVLANMLDSIGRAYLSMNELDGAEKHMLKAEAIRRERLPANHHDIAESHLSLGELSYVQRKLDEALVHFESARGIYERLGEARSADAAEAWNDIGVVRRVGRELDKAITAHQEAMRIRQIVFGERSLKYAESLNNLAAVYMDRAALEKGPEKKRADFQTAQHMIDQALSLRRELLSDHHPLVLQTISNRAVLAGRRENYADALALLREIIQLGPQVYGAESIAHATNLQSLGAILLKPEVDNPVEAEAAYRQALQIRTKRLGAEHRQTLDSQLGLGRALVMQYRSGADGAQERAAEGERLLTEGLARLKNERGRFDRRLAEAIAALARHYRATDRSNLAAEYEQLLEAAAPR